MSPPLAHWVHDLSPFVVRFTETIGIRYYGVAYLAGFFAAWWLLRVYSKRGFTRLTGDQIGDLVTALIVGVMVGGRLGYFFFYHPELLAKDPLILVRIWDGGMASHGGFLGVAAALWWCARRFKLPMLHLADLVVSVAPLGLFFGRIANFINGELWGRPSTVAWAVIFPESDPTKPVALITPRHPSQLYAAVLEGLLPFAIMQFLVWRTPWLREAPGRIAGAFLFVYAIGRSIGEQFREPDAGVEPILGLTRGTFYSIFLLIAGVVLMIVTRPKAKPVPKA